jgi:hypothetical protein
MAIAENNYEYEEQESRTLITGWHKVNITEITEPQRTKSGNATGFWIKLDVRVGSEIQERSVWLSFDHPHEFVTTKSQNIGHMLRAMFPSVTDDADYVGGSFWLLFRTYEDKKTGETKESFFDSKKRTSLDGKVTLEGNAITEGQSPKQKPSALQPAKTNNWKPASAESADDVPF